MKNLPIVRNFENKNHFTITDNEKIIFQSYETIIAIYYLENENVILDTNAEKYSPTTTKYLNSFLRKIAGKEITSRKSYKAFNRDNLNE
jgi:hypothetical protein